MELDLYHYFFPRAECCGNRLTARHTCITTNIVVIIGVHIYYYTQQIRNITGVHLSYSINFTVFPNKIFKE